MRNYMIRRIGHSIFIVAGLMGLLFLAINVLGDPVELMVDEDASQETIDALREKFGLDRPLYIRFADFYGDLALGVVSMPIRAFESIRERTMGENYTPSAASRPFEGSGFGKSLRHRIDAEELILDRLPNTAVLAIVAWVIGMAGIPLGMLAARRPRGVIDRIVNILSFAVISVPQFWLALMLILIISVQLDLLPTSGFKGLGPEGWRFMILPALALSPLVMGRNAQITRSTMIEEIAKQYVATARSKGLAETAILYGHVLKNASISIVTLMGDELAGFMNGSTVVEIIFGWPGIGKLLIDGINARDLPVVTAAVFVIALMVMVINLAVDLFYTWLDPRISYS